MTAPQVLVPVKSLHLAKSRVNLPLAERRRVAATLVNHTLRTAAATVGADSLVVVTADDAVTALGRELGAHVIHDPHGQLNPAVEDGIIALTATRDVIVLVSDLPHLTQDDLVALLEAVAGSDRPLHVPDLAGTGTTTVSVPRDLQPAMHFGPRSAEHFRTAGWRTLRNAPFGLRADLDNLTDLRTLGLPRPALTVTMEQEA